jgi:hypothetical protein
VRAILVGCLGLLGCNSVFGLDDTDPLREIADGDNDGIPDELDNCPAIANHDQADADDDGRGDACDGCDQCLPCDRGADHDEDFDKIADGCDNCPAQSNADQANGDSDELGDVCDRPGASIERRIFFDGFATLDASWGMSGRWQIEDDTIVLVGGTPVIGGIYGIANERTTTLGKRWRFETAVRIPDVAVRPEALWVGIYGLDVGETTSWACLLKRRGSSTSWELGSGAVDLANVTLEPINVLRLEPVAAGGGRQTLCSLGARTELVPQPADVMTPMFVQLTSLRILGVRFEYIDVIE